MNKADSNYCWKHNHPLPCPFCTATPAPVSADEVLQKSLDKGGVKHDGDKPLLALLPFEALEEVGKVLTFGAKKYAAHNWRGGFVWSRLISAGLRHIFSFVKGEDKDPETGLSHLAHAVCCLLFLLTFTLNGGGTDDRYVPNR